MLARAPVLPRRREPRLGPRLRGDTSVRVALLVVSALTMAPVEAQTTPSPTAQPRSAIDAERAFAADAQKIGQWAAFRKWAAPEAVMFVPQPTNAQTWLKDRPEPVRAVEWSPTASFLSCNGQMAVNTGEWRRPDGSVGYFTTVWAKQRDGQWRWLLDSGDVLATSRARVIKPKVSRATCGGRGRQPFFFTDDDSTGGGLSNDRTLVWGYSALPGGPRTISAGLWDGRRYREVIADRIAPPRP